MVFHRFEFHLIVRFIPILLSQKNHLYLTVRGCFKVLPFIFLIHNTCICQCTFFVHKPRVKQGTCTWSATLFCVYCRDVILLPAEWRIVYAISIYGAVVTCYNTYSDRPRLSSDPWPAKLILLRNRTYILLVRKVVFNISANHQSNFFTIFGLKLHS